MTSRPAAPESPLVDRLKQFAFHLRTIENQYAETMREKIDRDAAELMDQAATALSLAQTEIKGHMRVQDELKAEVERERMRVVGCSVAALGNWKEGDSLHADYDCVAIRDVAKLRVKYDEAQARTAELEKVLGGVLAEADRDTDSFIAARAALKDRA